MVSNSTKRMLPGANAQESRHVFVERFQNLCPGQRGGCHRGVFPKYTQGLLVRQEGSCLLGELLGCLADTPDPKVPDELRLLGVRRTEEEDRNSGDKIVVGFRAHSGPIERVPGQGNEPRLRPASPTRDLGPRNWGMEIRASSQSVSGEISLQLRFHGSFFDSKEEDPKTATQGRQAGQKLEHPFIIVIVAWRPNMNNVVVRESSRVGWRGEFRASRYQHQRLRVQSVAIRKQA